MNCSASKGVLESPILGFSRLLRAGQGIDVLNQIRLLWVDDKELRVAKATQFEPLPPGMDAFKAEEYAHYAAKKIIDALIKTKRQSIKPSILA
jgi:hypothetical protein